jgi:hypothetical protein
MQSRTKSRALSLAGGLVAALAVVPWVGAGSASATSGDISCATRPAGVTAEAECSTLTLPAGDAAGSAWAVRTSTDHLVVDVVTAKPIEGFAPVNVCAKTSPYPAKHQCTSFDADLVYSGSSAHVDVALSGFGIGSSSPVYYAVSVQQGSQVSLATGQPGVGPAPSPSSTPTTTPTHSPSPSPTTSPSHTPSHSPSSTPSTSPSHTPSESPSESPSTSPSESPSVSPSDAPSTSPSASVLPTELTSSPAASVLPTELAHTGGGSGLGGTAIASLALLGLGALLVIIGRTIPATARRRH